LYRKDRDDAKEELRIDEIASEARLVMAMRKRGGRCATPFTRRKPEVIPIGSGIQGINDNYEETSLT